MIQEYDVVRVVSKPTNRKSYQIDVFSFRTRVIGEYEHSVRMETPALCVKCGTDSSHGVVGIGMSL